MDLPARPSHSPQPFPTRDRAVLARIAALVVFAFLAGSAAAQTQTATTNEQADPEQGQAVMPTLIEARDLFMAGSYDEAIEAYGRLADDPRAGATARVGVARCFMQIGRYDDALSALTALDARASADWHYALTDVLEIKGRYQDVLTHAREAVKLDKNHAGARLRLARTLELLGRRDEALSEYRWFDRQLVGRADLPNDAAWITDTAVGFLRYSVLTRTKIASRTEHVLHKMLQMAYGRLDRTYWPARLAAADLLRRSYNNAEEDGSLSDYQGALRINPRLPAAHVGIGEVALVGWNFEEVEKKAEAALAINPIYPPAFHLLAKKLVTERRYAEAIAMAEQALAVNANDVVALSIAAAASACSYDKAGVQSMADRVAAISPRSALFHRTMGDALSGIRQYADSERAFVKAIALDGTEANARAELGMMYMQWGLEQKARAALEAAWELDPFNERCKFTLELLDTLDGFARHETDHFIIKYDPEKNPGIALFLADYLEQTHESVTEDYNRPLKDKTIIELFPTLRAFGVRITGKPWIHTVGACTGRVIALASPRDGAEGSRYNIANVLRHEFTHTVTLAATQNRIPHWFTEGLAVYQEDGPRSLSWRILLSDAVRRDRLFTLESINWGFIRPKRPNDRQLAYAQSEWMCEYLVERFGYDSINPMLDLYRRGRTQDEVFVDRLGIEPTAFDRDFGKWARAVATEWGFDLTPPENVDGLRLLVEQNPKDAALIGRLARAYLDTGELEPALEAARRALTLNENEPAALPVLGRVLMRLSGKERRAQAKRRFDDEAFPAMQRLLNVDPDGWLAPRYLGDIALRRDQYPLAKTMYTRLQRIRPLDPASWSGLSGMYLHEGELDAALIQLTELARLEDDDADVAAGIASIHNRRGRLREARYWYRKALFADPFSVKLHGAMGDTCMQAGDTRAALAEYRLLAELEPGEARHFERAAFAAHKLGDKDMARKLAARAVDLDARSDARSLLP